MLRKALPLVALVACSSSSQVPTSTPAEPAQPAVTTPQPTAAPAAAPPPAPAAAAPRNPKTVDDCVATAAASTGDDPSATSAAEATGTSDRSAAMTSLMKQKRPGFRCCFDIWADKIPEVKLYNKVALVLDMDPAGKLKKATAQPEEGGPAVSQEVQGCLSDVSASLTFPPSSGGKDTKYTYHFDFKPKSRH